MTTITDLGLQRTSSSTALTPEDVARLPHPAKLQHSPSLPNICSPLQSAPNTIQMASTEHTNDYGPTENTSPKPSAPVALPEKRQRHVKYGSIDPSPRRASGYKTHARRRTERDQPHSLLTPPLTPSSSIRTNASTSTDYSITSTAHSGREIVKTIAEDIVDPYPDATRILLLEKIKRTTSYGTLEKCIVNTFEKALAERELDYALAATYKSSPPRQLLKGINQRLQASDGKVFAVFYDPRVPKVVTDLLLDKDATGSTFGDCVDTRTGPDGLPMWLAARAVSLEEIRQSLGPSEFLRDLDATFCLSVQKTKAADESGAATPVAHDVSEANATETHSSAAEEDIDAGIVLNVLKPFGDVRCFNFSRQEVDHDGSSTLYYHVEFFDVRDCDAAWLSLDRTQKYGLTFKVAGNKLKPGQQSETLLASERTSPVADVVDFNGPVYSNHRRPFYQGQGIESGRNLDERSSQNGVGPTPNGGTSSPPVFYITSTGDFPTFNPSDPGAQVVALAQHPPPTPTWEQQTQALYRPGAVSPCYTPDGICTYCPSRGAHPGIPYNYGSFTTPPPATPVLYYPPPRLQPTPQLLPPPQNWGFDPAIAAVGPGGPPPMMPLHMGGMMAGPPSPAPPFFIRDDGSGSSVGARGLPGYPYAYPPYVGGRMQVPYPLGGLPPPPPPPQNPSQPDVAQANGVAGLVSGMQQMMASGTSLADSSPPRHYPAGMSPPDAVGAAGALGSPAAGQERNTLDLERIRQGLDTRTTIMIKNIPNKMSDADLTAYIGKVCPRAIDFLYLRMDFKNGCNVGYAFVNFITVADLLHFAAARLGAKWNMFSSEKVLQMSYANYQSKESLIEKFKNSAIMDERPEWRPRIFYSQGVNKGLPEPFPHATHIRRKERSSHNRGTLFPPGMNALNNTSHRISRRA